MLNYNSAIYDEEFAGTLSQSPQGGWGYGYGYSVHEVFNGQAAGGAAGVDSCSVQVSVIFPDGGRHVLYPYYIDTGAYLDTGGGYFEGPPANGAGYAGTLCSGTATSYHTTDSTYVKVAFAATTLDGSPATSWTIYFPDGRTASGVGWDAAASSVTDANGNMIAIQNLDFTGGAPETLLTDSAQRTITIQYGAAPNTDTVTQAGWNGQPLTWTLIWGSITPAGTYPCPGPGTCPPLTVGQLVMLQNLQVPAPAGVSLEYAFGYDIAGYGELNSVTLPSLANVSYVYAFHGGGRTAADVNNPLTQKTQSWCDESDLPPSTVACTSLSNPNTRQDIWTFAFPGTAGGTSSSIIGPDGGTTTTSFFNTTNGNWNSGLVREVKFPDFSTDERYWAQNFAYRQGTSYGALDTQNPFIQEEVRSVASGGLPTLAAISTFGYDRNGNLNARSDYDYQTYIAPPSSGSAPGYYLGTALRSLSQAFSPAATSTASTSTNDNNGYWYPPTFNTTQRPLLQCATVSGTAISSATGFAYNDPYKGDITETGLWNSSVAGAQPACGSVSGSNLVVLTSAYDGYGNLTDSYDGNGNDTHFVYDSNSLTLTARYDAYQTGYQRETTYGFDSASGLIDTQTDYNGLTRNYAYDSVNRLNLVTESGVARQLLRRTGITYEDADRRVVTYRDLATPGDEQLISVDEYDQLGRARLHRQLENATSQSVDDDSAGIKTQTRYLSVSGGSYRLVSNPYRAGTSALASTESTMGWRLIQNDQNGRVAAVTSYTGSNAPSPFGGSGAGPPSTGTTTTNYSTLSTAAGATTQTIDEAGVSRTTTADGLGRIKCVSEDGISAVTAYAYDSLGNLTGVLGSQSACATPTTFTRRFTYDSLSRLQSAYNPESGTTSYGYDANSNLISRTNGRGTACFGAFVSTGCNGAGYDSLNRPTVTNYNDGITPAVSFSYLGNGDFLSSVSSNPSAYAWTNYDALGRPGAGTQTTGGTSYNFTGLTWTPQSQVASMTYPSGRVVATTFDGADRPLGMTGQPNAGAAVKTYAAAASYAPQGGLVSLTTGSAATNDLGSLAYSYNARLQLASAAAANASGTLISLGFGYSASTNNGNLMSQSITRGSFSAAQTFYYDGVNRLCAAAEGGSAVTISSCSAGLGTNNWQQTYAYDNAGNRAVVSNLADGGPVNSSLLSPMYTPQVSTYSASAVAAMFGNNRWSGVSGYDGAGNVMQVNTQSMTYDAESRMLSWGDSSTTPPTAVTFTYDGLGNRVTKTSGAATTTYVYDPLGNLAAAYGGAAPAVTGTLYLATDHLGSTRLVTSGGAVVGCHDYLPFGEEIPAGMYGRPACNGSGETVVKFTGQERDAETAGGTLTSGLDHFPARYGSSAIGRFMSPDPAGNFVADPTNPQSWNMYSYVRNNPLKYIDPFGLCSQDSSGGYQDSDDGGTFLFSGPCSGGSIGNYDPSPTAPPVLNGPDPNNRAVEGNTVTEQQDPAWGVWDALSAFFGTNPKQLNYGPNDAFTQSFQKSAGMDAIVAGVRRSCPATTGVVPVGSGEAFVNTLIDGILGMQGFFTPEAQLGAFNSTYTRAGGSLYVTVTNPISLNSLMYHGTAPLGIKNPAKGHLGTVNQTLHVVATDPCR